MLFSACLLPPSLSANNQLASQNCWRSSRLRVYQVSPQFVGVDMHHVWCNHLASCSQCRDRDCPPFLRTSTTFEDHGLSLSLISPHASMFSMCFLTSSYIPGGILRGRSLKGVESVKCIWCVSVDESSCFILPNSAASSLGSAVGCSVEGRAIDAALGQCFIPNSSH